MELYITFWILILWSVGGLAASIRRIRLAGAGWIVVYFTILATNLVGGLLGPDFLVYVAAALWVVFVLLPSLIYKRYEFFFLQQRYALACRWARFLSWLHPFSGWRHQPKILRALTMAQEGHIAEAAQSLRELEKEKSVAGPAAMFHLYRLTAQWENLLAWSNNHSQQLTAQPQFIPALLRALGETGQRRAMVELFAQNSEQIDKLSAANLRDQCRLVLFAFSGRRLFVEQLFANRFSHLAEDHKQFWLATADLAAGKSADAKAQLDVLLTTADAPSRLAIERRLSQVDRVPETLDASLLAAIDSAGIQSGHDETFDARPALFSKAARATQILILANLLVFFLENILGGSSNPETLFRMGAMFPPAVHAGQWWRLPAALFLHFGPLHLAMNIFALAVLAPFVEFAFGPFKFLLLYFIAGLGSMGLVLMVGSGPHGLQTTVGASGAIMGMVGATAALMLKGWRQKKASSARRRLFAAIVILSIQTLFDAFIPQVSMTAHLSGALLGGLAAFLIPNRLLTPR